MNNNKKSLIPLEYDHLRRVHDAKIPMRTVVTLHICSVLCSFYSRLQPTPSMVLPDIISPMRASEHKFTTIQYSIYHHCQHTATNCAEQTVLYQGLTVFSLFGSSFPSNRYSFSVWRVLIVKHLPLLGLVQLDLYN